MKVVILLISIIGFTTFSCKKSDSIFPASLEGKWRMIIVKDNVSGLTTTKPSTIHGDVDITFASTSSANGTFTGNTPTNDIRPSDYSIGTNQSITIHNLGMTKVMETSWGNEFVANIRSAQKYDFEIGGRLNIRTTNKTLVFRKL